MEKLCDCIYTNNINTVQEGLRRGGLTPALAPRMPAITEYDYDRQLEAVNATVLPRGT